MGYVFFVISAILFSTKAIAIKLIYAEHVATEEASGFHGRVGK